jgi:hypothetical protein
MYKFSFKKVGGYFFNIFSEDILHKSQCAYMKKSFVIFDKYSISKDIFSQKSGGSRGVPKKT